MFAIIPLTGVPCIDLGIIGLVIVGILWASKKGKPTSGSPS